MTASSFADKQVNIDRINWYFQNSPPDYDLGPFNLAIITSIHYSGADLEVSDIESVRVFSNSDSWSINVTGANLNDSLKIIGYGYTQFYSRSLSANGSVMPIDTFNYEIKLKNGFVANKRVVIPSPGSDQPNGYKYIYTEDYSDQLLPAFTSMLKRPTPLTFKNTNDAIDLTFSIQDPIAFSGYVWLYDSLSDHIGYSSEFINYKTKAKSNTLNGGAGFYNNGLTNSFIINESNCTLKPGKTIGDAKKVRLVATDGKQYASSQYSYDCRSISILFP